ncbi:MAG: hypothetical protein Alpg2KO_26830 [Alphaproteobacteria bacterium]
MKLLLPNSNKARVLIGVGFVLSVTLSLWVFSNLVASSDQSLTVKDALRTKGDFAIYQLDESSLGSGLIKSTI